MKPYYHIIQRLLPYAMVLCGIWFAVILASRVLFIINPMGQIDAIHLLNCADLAFCSTLVISCSMLLADIEGKQQAAIPYYTYAAYIVFTSILLSKVIVHPTIILLNSVTYLGIIIWGIIQAKNIHNKIISHGFLGFSICLILMGFLKMLLPVIITFTSNDIEIIKYTRIIDTLPVFGVLYIITCLIHYLKKQKAEAFGYFE